MTDINQLIEFSTDSITKLKNGLKETLNKYNEVFTESQLSEVYSFIDNGNIEIVNNGYFNMKNDNNFDYISDILICQKAKKEILSNNIKSKLRKVTNTYNIQYLNGFKKYILNYNCLFHCATKCKYNFIKKIFTLNFDEIIDIASSTQKHYLDNIYVTDDNNKKRKIIVGDDGVQIYKIDFGKYGVYIGQSVNLKKRMNGHKNQARTNDHCYVLNQLYKTDYEYFCECLSNYKVLEKPKIIDYVQGGYTSTCFEYDCQIEALLNGERLLGKQCWDIDFRKYLATHVSEYEYQKLLKRSFEINRDPDMDSGYSTYNPCSKKFQNQTMDYKDVIKYFNLLEN